MRKIIHNLVYDTNTARYVGEYAAEKDGYAYKEVLYRKRTGEYFLYGIGNYASQYGKRVENAAGKKRKWAAGEKIVPIPYSKALQWAGTHLAKHQYDEFFGEERSEEREDIKVSLEKRYATKLRRYAEQNGMSLRQTFEHIIDMYVEIKE